MGREERPQRRTDNSGMSLAFEEKEKKKTTKKKEKSLERVELLLV
jgi:hypothetical protein